MKFKNLGKTDLKVSLICLGTMTWGEQNSQKDAFEQMDYSFEKGVNFLIPQNSTQFHPGQRLMEKLKR